MQRFAGLKNLHRRVAEGLCERGVLYAAEGKVLLIFSRKIYPELNSQPERRLIERLRKAIFGSGSQVDPRTAILVSLANSANLLNIPFDKRELKQRKERLAKLAAGELLSKATADAIQAAQAAVMVACMIPAMTVATCSG